MKGQVFAWDPPEEGLGDTAAALGNMYDAVDLLYRTEGGEEHNINEYLPAYQPRTLIMHIDTDQWLTVDQARKSVVLIPGAQIATAPSPIAHYAVFSALNSVGDATFRSQPAQSPHPARRTQPPASATPKHLGRPGKNINEDIKALVSAGLDPRVQRALDAVRVESLFRLLNLIAEKTISEPKHVDEVYNSLPKQALEAIEKRDRTTDS